MKKLITLGIFALILVNMNFAGDRMVFVERFTSSTCGPCASNNPTMEAFLNAADPDKITGIAYHMNWPAPGNDPMYHYNPVHNDARRSQYGINSIPASKIDGIIGVSTPYTLGGLQAYLDSRTNILSPFTIIVTDSTFGDSVLIRARIYTEIALSNPSVRVYFAVMERHITNISPPSTNGEQHFYDVMRTLTLYPTGETVSFYPGQTTIIERRIKKDAIWQPAELRYTVFLQQGFEIMNAGKMTNNFTLIPISSYKSVQQGQVQNVTYQLSIPVVAPGYTSPVTLSAEIDPPNAGITVSFPGGSTVSTFPSNFDMQVNSAASVPTGNYRVIVTGTNGNGKTHKTSVSLLVGQNYASVKANRSTLQFKVDNVQYNTAKLFTWDLNTQHNLSVVSPQIVGSTRYLFQSWSDNGDSIHNVTATTNVMDYTVNYKTQFKLIANISPGGLPVSVIGGNGYYDSASAVTFSVSAMTFTHNGKDYYFNRWTGNGIGSYNGTDPSHTISSMNNVIVQTAIFDTIPPIGIQNLNTGVPMVFDMHQNYPNPFNPVTKIKFDLPKESNVSIKVYDIIGNEVTSIFSGNLKAGYYEADFNGSAYASGVYFYRIDAGDFTSVKRMILVK
ncbi:MAG: T9SS type A sorting domain-containing protein [Ignavibacteria bacterium]|nr:T9SS type A sorting domain-containing protein [Ignavibacteria bacterium]